MPGKPWQQIIQLRQLHLQMAFPCMRPQREDIQDQLRAVNHAAFRGLFHVSQLHRRQIAIHDNQRNIAHLRFRFHFLQFSAPHQSGGIKRIAHLQDCASHFRARALGQGFQLRQ